MTNLLSPASQSCQTLTDWLCYIEQKHPQHQIELGLGRVLNIAQRADLHLLPGKKILIAGTNGKGTTARTLEQLCAVQGLSVGVYSSPHLLQFNERLRINGEDVADTLWCEAFAFIEQLRGDIELTYFEFTTLASFYLLKQQQPELCLIEVGLGGRLDATNIIEPDLSILTTVDLDHQDYLGPDRESIGREKAGVFRAAKPAVIGETDIPQSVLKYAQDIQAELLCINTDYQYSVTDTSFHWQGVHSRLDGLPLTTVPLQNIATAFTALEALALLPSQQQAAQVLAELSLPGRMQWLNKTPGILLDVAHNPQSAGYLAAQLQFIKAGYARVHLLVGMLKDKDIQQSLAPFYQLADHWHLVDLPGARGAEASVLLQQLPAQSRYSCYSDLESGYQQAQLSLQANDLLVIFGSFVTVSAVLALQKETDV
ncbi:bifunctional tetrahydrofolate synthase/dihydrofolate synthase [Rheinheimera soli]|uniref:Dihydrofolate synthase/folylpolyglutamate synthase n=1 Tax=Rheinheimera soli TaxID=443616 RepID=A0ABU1W4R4_9GAMM|nr:bifunctional tetrahydrofolate synthase/dihydrofolate synthase [Rheinheimera soli]MDR7122934.1 dihydrofolate synthase/folylpolyglutamate synthase [Rheinheimera soli]